MRATLTSTGPGLMTAGTVPFPASEPSVPRPEGTPPSRLPQPKPAASAISLGNAGTPREFGYRLAAKFLIGDTIFASLAIFSALVLREAQRAGWTQLLQSRPTVPVAMALWALGGAVMFMWLMIVLRAYEVKNLYRMHLTLKNVGRASILWGIGVWATVGLFGIETFSPRIGALYAVGALFAGIAFWRTLAFPFLIDPKVKHAVSSRVVVIGWNQHAAHLRNAMRMDIGQLAEIIGCVPMPGGRFAERPPADLAVLGDYSALPSIVSEIGATSVILADVSCSSGEIQHLIAFCQRELISFQLIPQYFPALQSGLQVQAVSGIPLLGVNRLPLDRTLNRVFKRTIDIVGALVGLAVCAMIVPIFALIVYAESPGPVLFRQRRTSRSGRDFYIYKIRSMRLNAETSTGAVWAKQNDPRRLRIGTFMRKTNVDELPQFWNVLKGDMSLVGPRPERPELIAKFKNEIPNYNARHEVRAGVTGWAQINGLRGDTDLTKRIEADLYYLENWSVTLDLYCIFATFFKIKNAY